MGKGLLAQWRRILSSSVGMAAPPWLLRVAWKTLPSQRYAVVASCLSTGYILQVSAKCKIMIISTQIESCQLLVCVMFLSGACSAKCFDAVPNLALVHIIQQCFNSSLQVRPGHTMLCSPKCPMLSYSAPKIPSPSRTPQPSPYDAP